MSNAQSFTLFCIPCAGSSSAMYNSWDDELLEGVQINKIELAGRGRRFSVPLKHDYVTAIEDVYSQLPAILPARFAIFGHSMGGLLAYGICQKLLADNRTLPEYVFISACASPTKRNHSRFENLESKQALINDLKSQGGTPKEVFNHPDLLEIVISIFSADISICRSFKYEQNHKLPIRFEIIAGRDDAITAAEKSAWADISSYPINETWFEGGHFYLQEHKRALLKHISHTLKKPVAIAS